MAKEIPPLKLFCLSQPLCVTEWVSLLGDKYAQALPFKVKLVFDVAEAQVIAWNGIITPTSAASQEAISQRLSQGTILLLMGEGRTLLQGHPFVKFADTATYKVVDLAGWSVLPEELLSALQQCWEKINHV